MAKNFLKVIKAGDIYEVYISELMPIQEECTEKEYRVREERTEADRQRDREANNRRAREAVRRLINANFQAGALFLTLTFRENMQNVSKANKCFADFIKRFKYQFNASGLKYLAVIEFQKRGAIHYHCIISGVNLNWQDEVECRRLERFIAEKVWQHGFCDIKRVDGWRNCDNVGAYLIKYMVKEGSDKRLAGHKRYLHSRNLVGPVMWSGEDAETIYNSLQGYIPVYSNEYNGGVYWGTIKHIEYNLKRTGGAQW